MSDWPSAKSLWYAQPTGSALTSGCARANSCSRGISQSDARLGAQCTYRLLLTPCRRSSVAVVKAVMAPAHARQVALAGRAQAHAVRTAFEQAHAQEVLEPRAIWWLTADAVRCSSFAAMAKLRRRATASKACGFVIGEWRPSGEPSRHMTERHLTVTRLRLSSTKPKPKIRSTDRPVVGPAAPA